MHNNLTYFNIAHNWWKVNIIINNIIIIIQIKKKKQYPLKLHASKIFAQNPIKQRTYM